MSDWQTIDGFGTSGMQPDLTPSHRAPGALDLAINVRPIGQDLQIAGSWGLPGIPSKGGNTLFYQQAYGHRYLYTASTGVIWVFANDWQDITGASVLPDEDDANICSRWSGGYLQQTMTFCYPGVVRNYVEGTDGFAQKLKWDVTDPDNPDDTWESKGISAHVMRPFLNFMFAGYIKEVNIEWPQRIMWCNPVEPLERPEIWEPSDTNLAGIRDLGDTTGAVVDMLALRNAFIIYKTDSIWSCTYVGDEFIFKTRRVLGTRGIAARDCVVEHNAIHYCFSPDDCFIFDGNTTQSILWGKAKRYLKEHADTEKAGNSFVTLDVEHEEVLFHFGSLAAQSEWPDTTLAYCWRTKSWTIRDYGGPLRHSINSRSVITQEEPQYARYALGNAQVVTLEDGYTQGGAAISSTIQRTALFADPGHEWVQIDTAKVGLVAESDTLNLRLGGQVAPSAPVVWRDAQIIDPATDYKTDVRQNDNYIAFELTGQTTGFWQLSHIDLMVQGSGKRG